MKLCQSVKAHFTGMRLLLLLMVVLPGLGAVSCIDDSISTSPHDLLSFSRDTVNFDTVFTDLTTPTARLVVRNRAKKGLNISSIKFKRTDTRFRLNVDGVSGNEFHNVEIRGRDSIYVFIECMIPETEGNTPRLEADDLEFVTNGVTQTVRVEAYGQNVTRLRNVRVSGDMRLTADRPYVIFDSLTVERGAVLRIDPGVQMLFHDGASLVVEGRIEALGEAGKLINMRGDRLDNVLPDVGYDILAGQWRGVRIAACSFDNRLEFVDMRSTVRGLELDSCGDLSRQKLTLRNSWLHNSQGNVLTSRYAKVDAFGCCFSEAAESVVRLEAGVHEFLQCTFANYYLFSSIGGAMIWLEGVSEDDNNPDFVPMKARFLNSIVYGLGDTVNIGELTGTQVFFKYVSFGVKGDNDDNFVACLWDTDPMFLTRRDDYYFNYRLQEDSPVAAAGNPDFVTPAVAVDMYGVSRLGHGNPSLGAFQVDFNK